MKHSDPLGQLVNKMTPDVDDTGVWGAIQQRAFGQKRAPAPRRKSGLRIAIGALAWLVVLAGISIGSFEAVRHWAKHESVLIITDVNDVTGDTDGTDSAAAWGTGAPASDNWQQLPLSVAEGGQVHGLVMDPSNPSILYAATPAGLFKSTDGAESWNQLPTVGEILTPMAIAIDPASPSTVYLHTFMLGETRPFRLWRSDDGGATWVDLRDESTPGMYGYVPGFSFDTASTPSTVYMLGTSGSDNETNLWRSTDRGETWIRLSKAEEDQAFALRDTLPSKPAAAQRALDAFLASGGTVRDADTGDVVVASNVVVDPDHPSTLYAATEWEGVYKSSDGGKTWKKASAGLVDPAVGSVLVDPSTPSTLYATTESAIVKSTDGGAHWTVILEGTGSVVLAPLKPSRLYAWTSAGLFRSDDGGGSWTQLDGTGLQMPIGEWPGQVLAVAAPPDTLLAWQDNRVFRSTDAGKSWKQAVAIEVPLEAGHPGDVVADSQHPSTFYVLTGVNVLKSTDAGATWTELAPKEWDVAVASLAVDPRDPAIVWVVQDGMSANEKSVIRRSTDGGNTWERVELGGLGARTHKLLFDPHSPNTLYAYTGPTREDMGIHRSTDGGATWENISEGFLNRSWSILGPPEPLYLAPDQAPGGALYAANNRGLFKWMPDSK